MGADSTQIIVFNIELAGYFDIGPTNNTLVVAQTLDRETISTVVVTVLATDQGGSGDMVSDTIRVLYKAFRIILSSFLGVYTKESIRRKLTSTPTQNIECTTALVIEYWRITGFFPTRTF